MLVAKFTSLLFISATCVSMYGITSRLPIVLRYIRARKTLLPMLYSGVSCPYFYGYHVIPQRCSFCTSSQINNKGQHMTQKTFDITRRALMLLAVALSIALIAFLEVAA